MSKVLRPKHENGKAITVGGEILNLDRVYLSVWRKSGAPLVTLRLTVDEADQLVIALRVAINKTLGADK